jgi:hypothetical protein
MPRRTTTIVICFKTPPLSLFATHEADPISPNYLIFKIQPEEGIGVAGPRENSRTDNSYEVCETGFVSDSLPTEGFESTLPVKETGFESSVSPSSPRGGDSLQVALDGIRGVRLEIVETMVRRHSSKRISASLSYRFWRENSGPPKADNLFYKIRVYHSFTCNAPGHRGRACVASREIWTGESFIGSGSSLACLRWN